MPKGAYSRSQQRGPDEVARNLGKRNREARKKTEKGGVVSVSFLYFAGAWSGNQLFVSYTSAVLCLEPATGSFTFRGTASYTGRTGQFAGASDTIAVESSGRLLPDGSGS